MLIRIMSSTLMASPFSRSARWLSPYRPSPDLSPVSTDSQGLFDRSAHDERLVLQGKVLHDLCVGQGVLHSLGVGEVRAPHEVVDGNAQVDPALGVGLVEGVHPDLAVEHLHG